MSGIRGCATDQGQFFISKTPEQAQNSELSSGTGPDFLTFTPEKDLLLTIWYQTKCACFLAKGIGCVPVGLSQDVCCAFQN